MFVCAQCTVQSYNYTYIPCTGYSRVRLSLTLRLSLTVPPPHVSTHTVATVVPSAALPTPHRRHINSSHVLSHIHTQREAWFWLQARRSGAPGPLRLVRGVYGWTTKRHGARMALDFNWHELSITVRVRVRKECTQMRTATRDLAQALLGPE